MKIRSASSVAAVLLAIVCTVACGSKPTPKPPEPAMTDTQSDAGAPAPEVDAGPPAPKSLYDRLGGKPGVTAVVEAFMKNATADADLKKYFAKTTGPKLDHFKEALHDFICENTGGGCKYAGKDMKSAHKGMKVTEAAWEAFVKDFTLALDEGKVGEKEKNEVFAAIAPLHDDVVEKKK